MCHRHRPSLVHIMAYRLDRGHAIIWTNAGILLIWPSGTNFNTISIELHFHCVVVWEMAAILSVPQCVQHEPMKTHSLMHIQESSMLPLPHVLFLSSFFGKYELCWNLWERVQRAPSCAVHQSISGAAVGLTKIDSEAVRYQKSCQNMVSDIKKNIMRLYSMFEVTKKFCLVFSVSKL